MLKDIISSTRLDQDVCASILGINPRLFNEWLIGQKPIPTFMLPELSTVFGVSEMALTSRRTTPGDVPAVWYKLRDENLTDSDREYVLLIRKFGFYLTQLSAVTRTENPLWKALFEQIKDKIDKQSSPSHQGKAAARLFASMHHLSHGGRGLGTPFRDNVRLTGLLIIETPVPRSRVEGCSFYVGTSGSEVPCLFANTYSSDWFRRNMVLAHELGHAIFDLDSQTVSLDFRGEEDYRQLQERRAQSFAQELFAPPEMLRHIQNTTGFKWSALTPSDLAVLVSHAEVSASVILSSALDAELISEEEFAKYKEYSISEELRQLTPHALTTREFLQQLGNEKSVWPASHRTTNLSPRRLRLPVSYVKKVISAAKDEEISLGKAAEMLMMDRQTVIERFSADLGSIA